MNGFRDKIIASFELRGDEPRIHSNFEKKLLKIQELGTLIA